MKLEKVLKTAKPTKNTIIQFVDKNKFVKYIEKEDSSWKDYVESEMFVIEYQDLIKSDFYIERCKDLDVVYAYRKKYDKSPGISLLIDIESKEAKRLREDALSQLILSGHMLNIERKEDMHG